MRVLFCSLDFTGARDALIAALPDHEVVTCHQDAVLDHLDGVDVLVPAMARVGAEIMDRGSFKLIQQFATGVENIDLAAAAERGIPVANIPADATGNAEAVAEIVILHTLAILRDYARADREARSGGLGTPVGSSLVGRRVALLGFGAVGRQVARRLRGFGVTVVAVGRRDPSEVAQQLEELEVSEYFRMEDRLDALAGADVLVVSVRVEPTSVGIVGVEEIAVMNPGGVLVNISRGAAVSKDALTSALRSGQLRGAGLDVYWQEPADPQDEIFDLNVSVTPHIGGVTDRSYGLMAAAAAENVALLSQSRPLLRLVAPTAPVPSGR